MTEGGYNKDEILKGERIILQASHDSDSAALHKSDMYANASDPPI
jgi:hypothetical protein